MLSFHCTCAAANHCIWSCAYNFVIRHEKKNVLTVEPCESIDSILLGKNQVTCLAKIHWIKDRLERYSLNALVEIMQGMDVMCEIMMQIWKSIMASGVRYTYMPQDQMDEKCWTFVDKLGSPQLYFLLPNILGLYLENQKDKTQVNKQFSELH